MIVKNNKKVIGVSKGNTPITKIYKGEKVVWESKPNIEFNGYDYVDMGDAGIWATCNVGANSPEEYGLYFAWGETKGYADASAKSGGFTWATAPYWVSGTTSSNTKWSKYTATDGYSSDGKADNKLILELDDDAAHVIMGGDWRMPTTEEFQALYDACDETWVTKYNGVAVSGKLFTLKTDSSKQLFFPAAGFASDNSLDWVETYGRYWSSSTKGTYSAYYFSFTRPSVNSSLLSRYYGFSVRGFIPKL